MRVDEQIERLAAAERGRGLQGIDLALVGDDPNAKSSTLPSSSDAAIYDLHMPIFYPGDVQEVVDLGATRRTF